MKFSDGMLFVHPVLSAGSTDYTAGQLSGDFSVRVENGRSLVVDSSLSLSCPSLLSLVEGGDAGAGFYLICRETYQNRLIEVGIGKQTHTLSAEMFFGTVQVRPVVWSKTSLEHWQSDGLNPEYGASASLPTAAVLAIGDEQRFSIDRERLRPFETIFSLAELDSLKRGQFSVDPDRDKITIFVHPETKTNIDKIRNDSRGKAVLLNAVYLPAVMQVLNSIRGQNLEARAWFRIFAAKCATEGINVNAPEALDDAQKLLRFPLARVEDQMERLFD